MKTLRWMFLILLALSSCGWAETVSNDLGWSLSVDPATGKFQIAVKDPAWTVGGTINKAVENVVTSSSEDRLGSYQGIRFRWREEGQRSGEIRLYNGRPIALFSVTFDDAVAGSPAPFPVLRELPENLLEFRYGGTDHLRPETFHLAQKPTEQYGGPFALFDAKANTLILSPANDFMVAMLSGDQKQGLSSGLNRTLESVPAGYTYQTLLAIDHGINHTWDTWGQSLTDLYGKKRPPSDADIGLKYLGYWTDNGSGYYYNYDMDKGYAGTLLALKDYLATKGVPIHYMQLDSWWYPKTFNSFEKSASDKPRSKDPKLPAGTWNRYGGMLEYTASPDLFPKGLEDFHKKLGLPLITHSRWIDQQSPYQKEYTISGVAAVDPKWWNKIISDIASWGVITYEQDWSNYIYWKSPQLYSTTWAGEAFLDGMAKACAANGLTMQYCMVLPRYVMQAGAKYDNFTTLRVSGDRLDQAKWHEFVYGSVMARAVGVWPFTDVFRSSETPNILIATLSAGMVGLSDIMGEENIENVFRAVRKDGVIVKPDVPLTPTDASFVEEGNGGKGPTVCTTHSGSQGERAFYIFAFQKKPADEAWSFMPAELGLNGSVFAYDYFSETGHLIEADKKFSGRLGKDGWTYWIMTPVGESGMSLIGDTGLFVTRGKNRIEATSQEKGQLHTTVTAAADEKAITLSIYAPAKPTVQVKNGTCDGVTYDVGTGIARAKISADGNQGGQMDVTFRCPEEWMMRAKSAIRAAAIVIVLIFAQPARATVPYFGVFMEVPPTSIQPQGWLAEMLQRQVNGLASHHAVSGYPYDTCLWAGKIPIDANPQSKQWWPYEQAGYLVDGLERLGLVTGNSAILDEANANVLYILNHPQANGSLGPDDIGPINWPHAVVFRALMAAYEAHPDPAIIQALQRHYLARPADFGSGRDVCNVEEMLWTYAHGGDERLLALAKRTYDNFNKTRPHSGLAALLGDSIIVEHGVTFNETAKIPALLYLYDGEHSMLDVTANGYHKIDRDHMLADGLHSAEERLDGSNPWSYHETCDVSDYTWSVGYLLMASGDCAWADHVEKTIFNAGFGSITKDFKSHQYFSSPNQVVAAPGICKKYNPDRLEYRPGHDVECCSGNVERFLPNFALRQWLTTPAGGIVAALYGPSKFSTTIDGTTVSIDEKTDYPFSETIDFVVHVSRSLSFPLVLRIPGWTTNPTLQINGQPFAELTSAGSFTTIHRTFTDGDILSLHLPMPLKIHDWGHQTASIERGPLVYSLYINESASPVWGAKTSKDFPAWDKQPASKWNYALVIFGTDSTSQLQFTAKKMSGCPWDTGNSPVEISAPVREIANWGIAADGGNPGFPSRPEFAPQVETARFVPDGTTCLRLTVLPVVSASSNTSH